MTRLSLLAALAVLAALSLGGAAPAADAPRVEIGADRPAVSTGLGQKFVLRSTITNRGSEPATGLIAHLNVLSLRQNGPYVDPEDWSARRTLYFDLPAGGSRDVTWNMDAVNAGTFGVYVTVVPESGGGPPASGPTVRVEVAQKRTLNSGGILPLAVGIPALLGLLALGLRIKRGG